MRAHSMDRLKSMILSELGGTERRIKYVVGKYGKSKHLQVFESF